MHRTLVRIAALYYFICVAGCSTPAKKLFGSRTPHEQYSNSLSDAGLNTTALGALWLNAAQAALLRPVRIQLPYKETGYFAAEKPGAAGYLFSAKRGQMINISINRDTMMKTLLFADLWQYDPSKAKFLTAADTLNLTIAYDAKDNADYILRIQPELLKSGNYTVTITASGSLAFPVPSENNPKIGSFWGDARDAGARKHEGVDIFGKKGTPVVAAADGYINQVGENTLGGKVIFLRPSGKDYSLYYAHLDSQIALQGQSVTTGQIIGLIGNTGNAKYTAPHLHFGIYTYGGAIDPLPFIQSLNKKPAEINGKLQPDGNYIRTSHAAMVFEDAESKSTVVEKINAGVALRLLAATGNWYKVELPNGRQGFIAISHVSSQQTALKTYTPDSPAILLEEPLANAAGKALIAKGTPLQVYGNYNKFYFVKYNAMQGWIRNNDTP